MGLRALTEHQEPTAHLKVRVMLDQESQALSHQARRIMALMQMCRMGLHMALGFSHPKGDDSHPTAHACNRLQDGSLHMALVHNHQPEPVYRKTCHPLCHQCLISPTSHLLIVLSQAWTRM